MNEMNKNDKKSKIPEKLANLSTNKNFGFGKMPNMFNHSFSKKPSELDSKKENKEESKTENKNNDNNNLLNNVVGGLTGKSLNPIEAFKFKIKLYLIGGAAGLLLIIFLLVGAYSIVYEPIQSIIDVTTGIVADVSDFSEKLGNWFTFRGFVSDQESFYVALKERNDYYFENDIRLNMPIIVSALFYNPNVTEFDYDKLREDAIILADAQVETKSVIKYCNTLMMNYETNKYEQVKKTCPLGVCDCRLEEQTTETKYQLISDDAYKNWLRTEYIDKNLESYGIEVPTDPKERANLVEYTLNEIYEARDNYLEFAGDIGVIPEGGYTNGIVFPAGAFGYNGSITYFNQKDYVAFPYGQFGNIKSHGCGPTSLAIVISSLKNATYDPVELTNWACGNGYCGANGSSHSLMTAAPARYGLKSRGISYLQGQELVDALSSGNALAIAIMGPGTFTNGGHFIVLSGVNDKNEVYVVDSFTKSFNKAWPLETIISETSKKSGTSFWIITK